jgi:hypothetical protein
MLAGWVSFAGDPIGCVSCLRTHCHPGPPFFSHRRHTLLLLVSVFSFQHHSLSFHRRPLLFQQQHSLSLLRRSLARSVCSDVPAGLSRSPPAVCALRIALNFSLHKAGAAAGRPATRTTVKGASGRRSRHPPRCRRGHDAASDHPPRGRAHLVESPRQGEN